MNLLQWCGWFFLGNALLFWLIALKYLPTLFPGEFPVLTFYGKWLTGFFIVVTYVGYLSFLAYLPLIFLAPLIFLRLPAKIIFTLAIISASLLAGMLFIDAAVYSLYRFHLHGVIFHLAVQGLSSELFAFSHQEYVLAFCIGLSIITVEILLAYKLWQIVREQKTSGALGKCAAVSIGICIYLSYALVAFSAGNPISRYFTDNVRFLPFYYELLMPGRQGLIAYERYAERDFMHPGQMNAPLNYPLQKNLHCSIPKNPLNLLIIVIDAWRFDMLNAAVTPFLNQFASQSLQFQQHFSGGNATGPGIFSLFYGLPAAYWTAMESQARGPVLISELMRANYQMGIFTSATLKLPAFDKTVFNEIKNLRLGTPHCKTADERDRAITQEFKTFVAQSQLTARPFFGFLFYDAAHSYCDINALQPFKPVVQDCNHLQLNNATAITPYLNRYQNALFLVDKEIKSVMEFLAARKLLANTVIMITGDHGEEFNDNHLNYWGHASNFTRYQIQTPLIVYWPGQAPKTFVHQTSHFDIAPTLLSQLLGCRASIQNYSVGKLLQDESPRPYFLVGSYIDFGVLERDRITTIFPLGNYEIDTLHGQPVAQAQLHIPVMQSVFYDLRRFYRKNL